MTKEVRRQSAALSMLERHHARGKAVDEVLPADRAQLALRDKAGQRQVARLAADRPGVVVRLREQAGAAAGHAPGRAGELPCLCRGWMGTRATPGGGSPTSSSRKSKSCRALAGF